MTAAELHLFESGTLTLDGYAVPVPFYLIRHPDGDVVVDGGNPLAMARDPEAFLGEYADVFGVNMSEDQHCVPQLDRLGVSPADIRFVVQTHLHFDHIGTLGHFPDVEIVVHERELEAARAGEGYVGDFDDPTLGWRPVAGDHDLFGDGSVRLLETPGHSAGHMSLLIALEQTGPVLLTADASDNWHQWTGRHRPRAFHSREQAAESMERLHEVAAEQDPLIVFGHDPRNWASLQHAPDRYV
ncbi:MAG TPA: N-acyl homoserine lactonase family protein [Solirubrobacteraceae bacterium]|nr:N-acyl homoserine lactonase family protein [Solirubrobacteraceae bacterium]